MDQVKFQANDWASPSTLILVKGWLVSIFSMTEETKKILHQH
jgi:hypothetical protein